MHELIYIYVFERYLKDIETHYEAFYFVCVLLQNARACIYGNKVSEYFEIFCREKLYFFHNLTDLCLECKS